MSNIAKADAKMFQMYSNMSFIIDINVLMVYQ
jgi:hypothetical protein